MTAAGVRRPFFAFVGSRRVGFWLVTQGRGSPSPVPCVRLEYGAWRAPGGAYSDMMENNMFFNMF